MNFLAIRSSKTFAATYDGFGRLLTYSRTGDPAQTNVYNGVDDRVSVTSGSTTRKYLYDGDGRQLGEYGASATAPVAETIWLSPEVANDNQPIGGDDGVGGYAPLAVAVGSGSGLVMQWVHGNHLGVPLVTTNASGAAIVPTGYTMPGFPGQTRTLSDIYYNRYRDYDSSTGRYIQADPIGLAGGANDYLYAAGNPLRYTDPSGNCPWCIAVLAGAAIGAAEGALIEYAIERFWEDRQCIDTKSIARSALFGAVRRCRRCTGRCRSTIHRTRLSLSRWKVRFEVCRRENTRMDAWRRQVSRKVDRSNGASRMDTQSD